jgi:hypothetical protein
MKRIQILTNFRSGGVSYYQGELRVVTAEQAGHFCACGWAKDADGELATGVPDISPKQLTVADGVHGNETEGV